MNVSIQYRDFCDVPRILLLRHAGCLLLLDSPFNDDADEYSASYDVYLMPVLPQETLEGSWYDLRESASRLIGRIPVAAVEFDATRRKYVDTSSLEPLIKELQTMGIPPMNTPRLDWSEKWL